MRRDDHVALFASDQAAGILREHGERVGIEHQRDRRAVDQRVHELRTPVRAEPGPQAITSCASSRTRSIAFGGDAALPGLGERLGHVLRAPSPRQLAGTTPASPP